ncbi:MAG: hypothetical protein MI725_10285 [Pirellulales bacterium]|nr:hypothetical protein [Pirellulales bacterium]
MPAVFEQFGLQFQYPDNWSAEHEAGNAAPSGNLPAEHTGQVVVSSPQTAFWQLTQYPRQIDLEPLFDEALSALRAEYESIEVEPADDHVEGFELAGYEVNFFCLDLTITCWLRGFKTPHAAYLLLCQAEDREFAEVSPVFRAMLTSVLQNLSV